MGSHIKWTTCSQVPICTEYLLFSVKEKVLWNFFVCVVRGPLTVVASPVAEHRLRTCRLSGHGSRAQPLRGMWDLPGPGHEPVSPASAGGLSTTAPPVKPYLTFLTRLWQVVLLVKLPPNPPVPMLYSPAPYHMTCNTSCGMRTCIPSPLMWGLPM